MTKTSQLREDVAASGVRLPDEVAARIDEIFPGPAHEGATRRRVSWAPSSPSSVSRRKMLQASACSSGARPS